MYNLLISANDESWDGEPWKIDQSRCVREYTDDSITEKWGELTESDVEELKRFPCIFAYEQACRKDPHFGMMKEIDLRQGKVRIIYELVELPEFISYEDLVRLGFELDIEDWEVNRTHWAVKDVDLAKELKRVGVTLPSWTRRVSRAVNISNHKFDVALSFPGESREYVEEVAKALEQALGPDSYFYDNNYRSQLARPGLDILLQGVYGERANLVVVFLSEDYQDKKWCGIEFRAIREIIHNRDSERVMFVRLDDGRVDGVFDTNGYIDARQVDSAELAGFICERVQLRDSADSEGHVEGRVNLFDGVGSISELPELP